MTIYNSGTIYLNKLLTDQAVALIKTSPLLEYIECEVADSELYFEDYVDSFFEDVLRGLVNTLSPLGYMLDGVVDYYGDYDGRIYVETNIVHTVDKEDVGLYEASDTLLITKLKERGYTVFKDGIEV